MNLPREGFSSDSYPGFKLHYIGNGVVIDLGGKYSNQLGTAIIILNSGKIASR